MLKEKLRAADWLAHGQTVSQTAKELKVSPRTILRRNKQPSFIAEKERIEQERREAEHRS